MREQRSFKEDGGALYLVPTPIGNLEDMTYRAIATLKEADLIAAEDTRHTKKLCHAFEITTSLISYHEHNKEEREEQLLAKIREGQMIALVSDAGMPAISDPGADLVAAAKKEGLKVIALPGANAALTGLIASGLSTDSFTFVGFVDRKKKKRKEIFQQWQPIASTLLFYEAPHRLKDMLADAYDVFGDREASVCREITKQYETIITGTLKELVEWSQQGEIRGECVVLISGASYEEQKEAEGEAWWAHLSILDHVQSIIDQGESSKDAIKTVAKERSLPKREVYQAYHVESESE
ncbi:16S rRNA (cytidine(1402)-2'-O)-methyltransferase [Paenalkalicoccus suaedae]|uniref:Ribosomal RNA small subunit methyltransferase I n=1 Tax=Paenalkalicoccus suaedae TaxID=2592382 RepID=A0A859FA19_9BACI|nr:16S rRNA (cytidine(1402)-2'-O)-methyltransferase [Paenalkalicoccus suaedae]QKS69628.1 16S rRNA (cytidine(1402)-2'-O)-methyltransferase [Paenalkalicoccus suaedae]